MKRRATGDIAGGRGHHEEEEEEEEEDAGEAHYFGSYANVSIHEEMIRVEAPLGGGGGESSGLAHSPPLLGRGAHWSIP